MSRDTLNERKWEEARAIQTRIDATTIPRDRRSPEYGDSPRSASTSGWTGANRSSGSYGIWSSESADDYARRMAKVHKTRNPNAGRGMSTGGVAIVLAIIGGVIAWFVSLWSASRRERRS